MPWAFARVPAGNRLHIQLTPTWTRLSREITSVCAYYHHFARAIIELMYETANAWERRSIELPPGWHALITKLSKHGRVNLKYVYSVAIDRMLSKGDFGDIVEAALELERRAKRDVARVGACHRPETLEKWSQEYERSQAEDVTRPRKTRSGRRR